MYLIFLLFIKQLIYYHFMQDYQQSQMSIEELEQSDYSIKMIDFVKSLYKKYKVLKKLSDSEKDNFQIQIIKLLVNQNEEVDKQSYNIMIESMGMQKFILEVLASVLQRKQQLNKKKIQKDISDINQILEEKQEQLTKKQKRIAQKQNKLKQLQTGMIPKIKSQADKYQKEIIENISKKQQEIIKKINNQLRSLKLKEEIIKQKINELKLLQNKKENLEQQQKKLKDRIKYLEKKEEELKRKEIQILKKESDIKKQMERKQNDCLKQIKNVQNMKIEISKLKTKTEQSQKKYTTLESSLKLKSTQIQQKDQVIYELQEKLQKLSKELQNRTVIKPLLLNQQLNISQINIKQDHQISKEFIQKSQYEQDYIIAIDILLEHFHQDYIYNIKLKNIILKSIKYIVEESNNQYQNIFKICIKWILNQKNSHFNQVVSKFHLRESQSIYVLLMVLFSSENSKQMIECLDNMELEQDHQKLFMIKEGYLQRIIEQIAITNIFDKIINNHVVLMILRLIQHGEFYEDIMELLSEQFYLNYLQEIFEKYEMQQEIIENLSVLISRIAIFKSVKFRDSFLKRLKLKMKILKDGLIAMNLKSILENCIK